MGYKLMYRRIGMRRWIFVDGPDKGYKTEQIALDRINISMRNIYEYKVMEV